MGSFAYTCAISGLPIEDGDKVRYLLLTKNPYHNGASNTCSVHDLWFPRTFPLKGLYDNYGSIKNITAGPEQEIWLEGFKKDLVEQGWGDNPCHDVPTNDSMNFDELLNAIQEGRVLVNRKDDSNDILERIDALLNKKKVEDPRSPEEKRDSRVPAGIPTMYRIQKIAETLGIAIYDGNYGKPTIMIDSPKTGEVRVRCHSMYGKNLKGHEKFSADAAIKQQIEVLSGLQDFLGDYSTMISTSSAWPNNELLVRPKPGTPNGEIREMYDMKPLPVGHAMIREDVWQALIKNNTVENWNGKNIVNIGIEKFYEGIDAYVKYTKTQSGKKYGLGGRLGFAEKVPAAWIVSKNDIPFSVGLATHFDIMMQKEKQPKEFFKTVAEFAFISEVLAQVRYQWRPSSSAGPQFGEWEKHELFLKSLADIAHKYAKQKA